MVSFHLRLSHAKNELVARECQIKELTKETIELKRENSELHGRQVFRGGRKDGVGAREKCREVGGTEDKRNKGWELEMEGTGGGGFGPPSPPPPTYFRSF